MTPVNIDEFIKSTSTVERGNELKEFFANGCECAMLKRFGKTAAADVQGYEAALRRFYPERRIQYTFFTRKDNVFICPSETYRKIR